MRAGYNDFSGVESPAEAEIYELHEEEYVNFLLALSDEIDEGREYIPPVFHGDLHQAPLWFRGGLYCREIGTPIGHQTVQAAFNSAAAAISAAEFTLKSGEDTLALCRPPGHHAGRTRYGGYCFFNNAYLAANVFIKNNKQTFVLDIDYHIGDGSCEFASHHAPYYSLHADPRTNYPYLSSVTETDNPNLYLRSFEQGVGLTEYLQELRMLMDQAARRSAPFAVLSVGFDTLSLDYIQDEQTAILPPDFEAIGAEIAKFDCPIVSVFEGGYDRDYLEDCSAYYFSGFKKARQ